MHLIFFFAAFLAYTASAAPALASVTESAAATKVVTSQSTVFVTNETSPTATSLSADAAAIDRPFTVVSRLPHRIVTLTSTITAASSTTPVTPTLSCPSVTPAPKQTPDVLHPPLVDHIKEEILFFCWDIASLNKANTTTSLHKMVVQVDSKALALQKKGDRYQNIFENMVKTDEEVNQAVHAISNWYTDAVEIVDPEGKRASLKDLKGGAVEDALHDVEGEEGLVKRQVCFEHLYPSWEYCHGGGQNLKWPW